MNEYDEDTKYEIERQKYHATQKQIIELIKSEAEVGIIHTMASFGVKFQCQYSLGRKREISDFLSDMGRNKVINFFNNPEKYGIVCPRKYKIKTMFMCTPEMEVKVGETQIKVIPTHYKLLVDGSIHKL